MCFHLANAFVVHLSVHASGKCEYHPPKSNMIISQEKGNYDLTNEIVVPVLLALTLVNTYYNKIDILT